MKTKYSLFSTIFLGALLVAVEAHAGTLDDIGFTDLKLELGSALPDGGSIAVTQVEAPVSGACAPDMTRSEFSNITFNDNTLSVCSGVSGHATSVATRFYGTVTSALTAIGSVDLFEAVDWLLGGFLGSTAYTGSPTNPTYLTIEASIGTSAARIANHSWAASTTGVDAEILRRVDYLVEVDEFIQVIGVHTNTVANPLLSSSFNAIVAGLSAGTGTTGTPTIVTNTVNDTTYVSGRAKPDIASPESTGSASAPRISSAAVLLMDYAHTSNAVLSNGSITNANGTIYNAELSETIKALLMAGADRATVGNTNAFDITDYRAAGKTTTNGLDTRFGAGQLNIYNSYHILNAGEKDSAEDGGTTITNAGFDYDPSFGGLNGSNATATYSFTTSAIGGQKIKAALVWNLDVLTTSTDNLYDLDLQLIDVTDGGTVVTSSASTIDNTENIWFDLVSNNDYQLKVIPGVGQAAFEWDYALAWQIVVPGVTVVETDSTTMTSEDGTTDTFTVVLDSPPAGDVTISLVSSDTAEGTVSPSSLTFTSANWSTLQTVTVTGVNDAVDDGDKNYSIDFTVSSATDTNYKGMTLPGVSASNTDDDATFSFTDQTDVALNSLITSNAVVVTGLLNTTAIALTGGEYSINGGIYTSTNGSINNNDSITLQTTSSVAGSTSVNVILTIGDVGDTFSVTTETDTDADGVGDSTDAFPNDPDETVDTDSDGVGDNADAFPNDPAEMADTDSDGVGDNADAFPDNIAASVDDDNDGLPDAWNVDCDVTCQDNSGLTLDTSLDDTDNDGAVNGSDAFPNDPTETLDTDGDGVGDNADAFPTNNAASVDADNDGLPDAWNASCNTSCQSSSGLTLDASLDDTDNDGVVNGSDAFPNDPTETTDTDGDGVGDNADDFPTNPDETIDTDGDGVGDNADTFPNDPAETADTDGDGIGDNADAFPTNNAASVDADNDGLPDTWNAGCNTSCQSSSGLTLDASLDDTDNDGVVNGSDAFPNDPTETTDTDGDGVGDNTDAFPNDPDETVDTDGDGIGDNADAFPDNIAASVDDDNDGLPDEWNADCDAACQDDSGLTLDVATDAATGTSTSSGGGGSLGLMWLLLPLFITAGRRRVL